MRAVMMAAIFGLLCGCSGGGTTTGSAPAPAPVSMSEDSLTLHGQAGWPGATTLALTIDGIATPMKSDGRWEHRIDLRSGGEQTVRLTLIADGVTVTVRDVVVRQ